MLSARGVLASLAWAGLAGFVPALAPFFGEALALLFLMLFVVALSAPAAVTPGGYVQVQPNAATLTQGSDKRTRFWMA